MLKKRIWVYICEGNLEDTRVRLSKISISSHFKGRIQKTGFLSLEFIIRATKVLEKLKGKWQYLKECRARKC
jgi:hypothetical protein